MTALDDVLQAIAADPKRGVFVSRSGVEVQRELAIWIAWRLKANGYIPVLQDAHFKHADFMLAMHRTLAAGVRVLALMSREYMQSQYCLKEATAALDDQTNSTGRLVPLNIDDSSPTGVFRYMARVRLAPAWQTGDAGVMERVVLKALEAPADLDATCLVPAALDAAQLIHAHVLMHDEDAFAGREDDLGRLRDVLWNGGTAALTGMGGVGKTTLARAYAFRNRGDYHGIWWVRAETTETLIDDLIELGRRDIPDLDRREDRAAAAREALQLIARRRTSQPWLLVYDNAPGPGVLTSWRPQANAHVIVTSRNPHWTAAVALDVFTPEAAVTFLCDTANRQQAGDRQEAAALAAQLGRLPLALAHAASKCQGNRRITFAAYGRRLTEFWADRPGAHDVHGRYGSSVFGTFSLALDDIVKGRADEGRAPCPEAELVMGVLAHVAPEQIPAFLLAPLYSGDAAVMSEAALDRALEELAGAALVTWGEFEDGAPHLGVHRLVQEIMRARLAAARRAEEVAALATRAVRFSYDWQTGTVAGDLANGRWLPHADAILSYAPEAAGDGESWAAWIAFFMGDVRLSRGSTSAALADYRRGQRIAEHLAKADPGNTGWQRDLSVSNERLGDILVAQGKLGDALAQYRASLERMIPIRDRDQSNMDLQRFTSVTHNKIGDVLVEQGNLPAALDAFNASLAIRDRLAKADPGNAGWQRDLSVSHIKIGDVLVEQGNLPAALDAFNASLAIRDRLAKADPGNAGWQRDLSVSHTKIGDVLVEHGNLPAALDAFNASLALADRLAKADPGNAGWQRDLSVLHDRIGDALVAQGNLPAALDAFNASLAIADRLAKADPGNAGWQRDLAASTERIGDMHAGQGETGEAIAAFERALGVYQTLVERNPDDLPSRVNSVVPLLRLGGLKGNAGRADLEAALGILKPLAAADRLDARRKGWIPKIEAQIAALSVPPGSGSAAPVPPGDRAAGWMSRWLGR